MPVLLFSDDFTQAERKVYARTFSHACREMGIDKIDASVSISKEANADLRYKGRVVCIMKDFYQVVINGNNGVLDGTYALCHETIHIKQFIRGEMIDHPFGVIWQGTFYPAEVAESELFYYHLPWEREAHAKTDAMHSRAVALLDGPDQESLMREAVRNTAREREYA